MGCDFLLESLGPSWRATNPSLAAGERALPLGLGVTEGVGAVREAAVVRQEAKVFGEKIL